MVDAGSIRACIVTGGFASLTAYLLQINSGRRANGMMAEGTRHDRGT